MNIIAILERSAGNSSIGEMWKETKSFPIETSVNDVIRWAYARHNDTEEKWSDKNPSYDIKNFRGNLTITISQ